MPANLVKLLCIITTCLPTNILMDLTSESYRERVDGLVAVIEKAFGISSVSLIGSNSFRETSMNDVSRAQHAQVLAKWMCFNLRTTSSNNFKIFPLFLMPFDGKFLHEIRARLLGLTQTQAKAVALYVQFACEHGDTFAMVAWTKVWRDVHENDGQLRI